MSLILGCWQYTNNFHLALRVEKMFAPLQNVPYEIKNVKMHNSVAMGHMLTYNTPESVYENAPIYLPERQILFTAQGRIDNRKKLADLLNLKLDSTFSDSFFILKAFLKWGQNCIHYLQGDWSFAVFNYQKQELFIARDPMGYTSLYYYQDTSGFYFSSSIKSLISLENYTKKQNEEHFVRKLTLWDDNAKAIQSTFYDNINSLPIAHTLKIKDNLVVLQKYWDPQNIPLRIYKNKQNYADEMLEIFSLAVNERMRSYKPVASMLSGGLDSSTVSYIAAEILKSKNIPLTTISHIPLFTNEIQNDKEKKFRILDETPFIKEIATASNNMHTMFLNSENYSVVRGMEDSISFCSMPLHGAGNLYWVLDIFQNISQKGFGSLLTGEGGNGSISFAGIDYLLPFNFSSLIQHPFDFFKIQVIKPIVKMYFNDLLKNRKKINNSLAKYSSNIFLRESILEKYEILNDIRKNKKEFYQPVSDVKEIKSSFINSYHSRSQVGAACGQHFGFELRDPCTDINVMEYFFSIPNDVFFDSHYNNRMLVKRMMSGKIPDKVLFEKRKGLQNADIVYRIKAQAGELSAIIEKVKRSAAANEYINTQKLTETWKTYLKADYTQPYQIQRLLKALHFALFLHTNFD